MNDGAGDILLPELVWIEGRCYRSNEPVGIVNTYQEQDLYEIEMTDPQEDDFNDEAIEVEMINDTKFIAALHVPQSYLGSIIGQKGATKGRIEHETKTTIKIPKRGDAGPILITGSSKGVVKSAYKRLKAIVLSARQKQKCTHFISIPMNNPDVVQNFNKFKESVLEECAGYEGIEESLFISGAKLHVTVGVMALMDQEERKQASQLLTDAKEDILGIVGTRVRLRGLSHMQEETRAAHVLYAVPRAEPPADPDPLQELCNKLQQRYIQAGLMFGYNDREDVKMHVTLMNTSYRKDSNTELGGEASRPRYGSRKSFDATRIFQKFSEYDFGVSEIKDVRLSIISTEDTSGYYQSTCVVP